MYLGCNYRPQLQQGFLVSLLDRQGFTGLQMGVFSTCLKLGQCQCIRLHLIQQGLHHGSKSQAKHYLVRTSRFKEVTSYQSAQINRPNRTDSTHQKRLRVVSNICMSFSSTAYIPGLYITLLALWWLLFKASCPCYLKFTVAVQLWSLQLVFQQGFQEVQSRVQTVAQFVCIPSAHKDKGDC